MEKVAKFQPDMVKIGFAARLLQIYRKIPAGQKSIFSKGARAASILIAGSCPR